jgi:hypothetical protein
VIRVLLLILVIQCAITAAVYWPQEHLAAENPGEALLSVAAETVTRISIADAQGAEVELLRTPAGWTLPELAGLSADSAQVDRLLKAITEVRHGFPVASSVPARQRFEVADYHYQRRIRLSTAEGEESTVFLGTAPAFQQVHARHANRDPIYSLPFSAFDAPANAGGWLDRTLLRVADPQRVRGNGFQLTREGNRWQSATGASPEPRELEALLLGLANLQVDGVADEDQRRQLSARQPAFSLATGDAEGERQLAFYTLEDKQFVRDTRYDLFFTLSAYDFDRLRTLDVDRLNGGP